jgi:tRNA threonylcarbamoyl adenosine modification protein YeaZ
MLNLLYDCSGKHLNIALYQQNKLLAKQNICENHRHSELLVSSIDKILQSNKINYSDINKVITTTGPGSFTGLRVGITFAKILKLTKQTKVVAIDNFSIYAYWYYKFLKKNDDIYVALDSGNQQIYLAKYSINDKKFYRKEQSFAVKFADFKISDSIFCGNIEQIRDLEKSYYQKDIDLQILQQMSNDLEDSKPFTEDYDYSILQPQYTIF